METISTDSIETFDSLKLKLNIFFSYNLYDTWHES